MARHSAPLEPRTLTPLQLRAIVGIIQEILWLRSDGTWDPDKEWGVEAIEEVAQALTLAGLRPA